MFKLKQNSYKIAGEW